jgi:hypothetical protein
MYFNSLNIMSKANNYVFSALRVVAWVIFVGLCVEAGGLIVNFIFSIYNPDFVKNLYQKLDLSGLYNLNRSAFYGIYSFILAIAALKVVLFYCLVFLVTKIDLSKPFNIMVSGQIEKISYYTFSTGLLSYIGRQYVRNLSHHGFVAHNLTPFWADAQAYILMGAVIYVIAIIFQKGIELQNENDLTV